MSSHQITHIPLLGPYELDPKGLMIVLPYLSQIVALFDMLPPKLANIQHGRRTVFQSNALR